MHRRNPWIADYLEALAGELVANGATRIGVKQLWEVLRYTYTVGGGADGYRLNNVLTSRYARLLIERHPAWAGLIETRELRAA